MKKGPSQEEMKKGPFQEAMKTCTIYSGEDEKRERSLILTPAFKPGTSIQASGALAQVSTGHITLLTDPNPSEEGMKTSAH